MANFWRVFNEWYKKETPIYLDQEGYAKLLASIEELKARLSENNKGRKGNYIKKE